MKFFKPYLKFFLIVSVIFVLPWAVLSVQKLSSHDKVSTHSDLDVYEGYEITEMSTDWLGNWVIVEKGADWKYFRCSETLFKELKVSDIIN